MDAAVMSGDWGGGCGSGRLQVRVRNERKPLLGRRKGMTKQQKRLLNLSLASPPPIPPETIPSPLTLGLRRGGSKVDVNVVSDGEWTWQWKAVSQNAK